MDCVVEHSNVIFIIDVEIIEYPFCGVLESCNSNED